MHFMGALMPNRWALWQLSRELLFPILVVHTMAIVAIGILVGDPVREMSSNGGFIAILLLLGAVHTEIGRDIEKLRWRVDGDLHVDLGSTWTLAAAALLPPAYAAIVAGLLHGYGLQRAGRARTPLYRNAFSVSTIVLACLAASVAMRHVVGGGGGPIGGAGVDVLAVGLGALVFLTVNTALVAGAIAISTPHPNVSDLVGEWDDNLLEVATLCLGGIVAAALTINPWLALFVFPPLLVLHRAVLVRHLQVAASTDGKTGLLNAAAWHTQAERELRRAERREGPRAVLVIDLDHFKNVNDTHGHLAGDRVLAAVADSLKAEVRDQDLVGRFGGEEFVVLLGGLGEPGDGHVELLAVAERIRQRIAALRVEMPTADGPLTVAGLSASVGGSLYPGDGRDLRTLLHVADTALYAAKRAGRNVVRMGLQLPTPAEALDAHPAAEH